MFNIVEKYNCSKFFWVHVGRL